MKKQYYIKVLIILVIYLVILGLKNSKYGAIEVNEEKTEEIKREVIEEEREVLLNFPSDSNYSLRKYIYDGNYENLKVLHEKENDDELKKLLELGIYNTQEFNNVFNKVFNEYDSKSNYYQPNIYYGIEFEDFKFKDIVYKIVDARAGKCDLDGKFELIKPDVDQNEFAVLVEKNNLTDISSFDKVYNLDLDNDGKDEYIVFFEYKEGQGWSIFETEDDKLILEDANNLYCNIIDIYKYQDIFLLLSEDYIQIYDNGKAYEVHLTFQNRGSTVIFRDIYKNLDWTDVDYLIMDALEPSFEKYSEVVGQETEKTQELLNDFYDNNGPMEFDTSSFGMIDYNNDGILDVTMSNWFAYGNINARGIKSVSFLDGNTKKVVDFTSTLGDKTSIVTVTSKFINGKNYFMVQYGTSYPENSVDVFKLIEFVDNEPVVVQEFLATTYGNILVDLVN